MLGSVQGLLSEDDLKNPEGPLSLAGGMTLASRCCIIHSLYNSIPYISLYNSLYKRATVDLRLTHGPERVDLGLLFRGIVPGFRV